MNTSTTLEYIAARTLLTWASSALDPDGQGLLDRHWLVSDSLGFETIGVFAAAAMWFGQKTKGHP